MTRRRLAALIPTLLATALAFPSTAQADAAISIHCDSHSLEIHVGSIDIHLSGDFNCDERSRGD